MFWFQAGHSSLRNFLLTFCLMFSMKCLKSVFLWLHPRRWNNPNQIIFCSSFLLQPQFSNMSLMNVCDCLPRVSNVYISQWRTSSGALCSYDLLMMWAICWQYSRLRYVVLLWSSVLRTFIMIKQTNHWELIGEKNFSLKIALLAATEGSYRYFFVWTAVESRLLFHVHMCLVLHKQDLF